MKKEHLIFIFIATLLGNQYIFAQKYTAHYLANIAYNHHKNFHNLELGGKILLLKNDDITYRLGAAAMIGRYNSSLSVVPKASADIMFNFQKGKDISHSFYYLLGTEVTPYFVTPKIGGSVLGILQADIGYTFPHKQSYNPTKGVMISIGVNIPLVIFQ